MTNIPEYTPSPVEGVRIAKEDDVVRGFWLNPEVITGMQDVLFMMLGRQRGIGGMRDYLNEIHPTEDNPKGELFSAEEVPRIAGYIALVGADPELPKVREGGLFMKKPEEPEFKAVPSWRILKRALTTRRYNRDHAQYLGDKKAYEDHLDAFEAHTASQNLGFAAARYMLESIPTKENEN